MARDKTDKTPAATLATTAASGGPFPEASDDGMQPFRAIAQRWGTDENTASDAFRGVEVPEWASPEHLDTVKGCAGDLNRAARVTEKLIEIIRGLPESERDMLITDGCVTIEQLQHLCNVLADDASYLTRFYKAPANARHGGRNPAAYAIAEGMRRLFRWLRKPITFGCSDFGLPTTDYCKGVEHALGAFGVRANWRGPARESWEKQLQIKNRHLACAIYKAARTAPDQL